LEIDVEAAVRADPVHTGRLRVEAVQRNLPTDGARARH
jgi:hypothetical protein